LRPTIPHHYGKKLLGDEKNGALETPNIAGLLSKKGKIQLPFYKGP